MTTEPTPPRRGAARATSKREVFRPRVREDGSLLVTPRVVIPPDEVATRVTTSGGPGGQHANRSLTRVVVSFDIDASAAISEHQRAILRDAYGDVVRSTAGRFRSQSANRAAALDQLARRLGEALAPRTPRRATRPTKASRQRRLDDKRSRGQVKERRRVRDDD